VGFKGIGMGHYANLGLFGKKSFFKNGCGASAILAWPILGHGK
jgi:hypothetical protein